VPAAAAEGCCCHGTHQASPCLLKNFPAIAHLDGILGGEGPCLQLERVAGNCGADGGGGGRVCLDLVAVGRSSIGGVRGRDEHVKRCADLHAAEALQRVDGRGLALDGPWAQQGCCQQAGSSQEGARHLWRPSRSGGGSPKGFESCREAIWAVPSEGGSSRACQKCFADCRGATRLRVKLF
jgi:hypothetical protein